MSPEQQKAINFELPESTRTPQNDNITLEESENGERLAQNLKSVNISKYDLFLFVM